MKRFGGKEKRLGFTTTETLVVVGICAFVTVVAIQNLMRTRVNTNEQATQMSLLAMHEAMKSYRETQTPYTYADQLSLLSDATPPYLPAMYTTGERNGYSFTVAQASADTYVIMATPASSGITGNKSFYITEKGEVVVGTYGSEPGRPKYAAD